MKWLCNVLSWCFTSAAVALLSLLVGSFLLNAKAKANSPTTSHLGVPPVCMSCTAKAPNEPGICPTFHSSDWACPQCTGGSGCP